MSVTTKVPTTQLSANNKSNYFFELKDTISSQITGTVVEKQKAVERCLYASLLWQETAESISSDIYPKWEMEVLSIRYPKKNGGYVDIDNGMRVIAKWTSTGQKILM